MPRPADGAEIGFHSSTVFGKTFQFELSGAPMRACIAGLTVSGTGSVRAGTSSGFGALVCVWASDMSKTIIAAVTKANPRTKRWVKRKSVLMSFLASRRGLLQPGGHLAAVPNFGEQEYRRSGTPRKGFRRRTTTGVHSATDGGTR
jgi:hypothetical protein